MSRFVSCFRFFCVLRTTTIIAILTASFAGAEICVSTTNTFTSVPNIYASETGYFAFEECGSQTNPTIGIEVGETYTFIQRDKNNYMHPLGFGYSPDGPHGGMAGMSDMAGMDGMAPGGKTLLEPGVVPGGNATGGCADTLTCPAPMYFVDGKYVGMYSNIPAAMNVTTNEGDFGMDNYVPLFYRNLVDWTNFGTFEVMIRFDQDYGQDLFYFCHVHQLMSGRIKLLRNGVPINAADTPEIPYKYESPGSFDLDCGTFGLESYQLPNSQCPDRFVCGKDAASDVVKAYSTCTDAMNCHMLDGMTTGVKADDPRVLFCHQMIPHHQNAVNMAKALLKTDALKCNDVRDQDNQDCVMIKILFDIINGQNLQIQEMLRFLDDADSPRTDNCDVFISSAAKRTTNSRQRRRAQGVPANPNEAARDKLLGAIEDAADIFVQTSKVIGHLFL